MVQYGQLAEQLAVGDASSTRTVYAVVLALIAIGLALIGIAIWLIRQTRPDPVLLAPLERMADRSWRKQDPAQRRRLLDEARPPGAKPVSREKDVPEVDSEFDQPKPAVARFDDLHAQQHAERRRAGGDPLLANAADDSTDVEPEPDAAHGVDIEPVDSPAHDDASDETAMDRETQTGDDTGEVAADPDDLSLPAER